MRIAVARKITTEDIKKAGENVDKKFDVLIEVLNPLIENFTALAQNRITLSDNMAGTMKSVSLTHATTSSINPGVDISRVNGVIYLDPGGQSITAWYWAKNGSSIDVKASFSAGSGTATVKLFIFYT